MDIIIIVLDIQGKHNFHIIEIPTNKGANSYKLESREY